MLTYWEKKWNQKLYAFLARAAPLATLFVIVLLGAMASNFATGYWFDRDKGQKTDEAAYPSEEVAKESCNVIGIEIRGCVLTYKPDNYDDALKLSDDGSCDTITSSEEIVGYLKEASKDDKIKAVLIEIDSPGGMPVAAEEIAEGIKTLGKPSVAWIRGTGASAAYWVASAANTVIASANSDVGSIGVTFSYIDNAQKNAKEGLTYNILSAGKYKDMGSLDKPLTADERSLIERDLNIIRNNFISAVAANRKLSESKVRALADGSSMLGVAAKDKGLVDLLGTQETMYGTLQQLLGGEKPVICWP